MQLQHFKDNLFLAGQLTPEAVAALARETGINVVVNNRPDGEEAGQPTSAELQTACGNNGLNYYYLPMRDRGDISSATRVTRDEILADHHGAKILFFCRSGGRSEALLSHQ